MDDETLSRIRGRYLGFIFQSYNLIQQLSVVENIEVPLSYQRPPMPGGRERCLKLAELVGLSKRLGHRPTELSGGQQQRVAIARALVQEPEIVLADEPIASLDPRNTKVVMDALQRLNKHFGITVICNLHDLDIAKDYCDRLVGMAQGRVVFDGAPDELTESAARELYGLEAHEAMTVLPPTAAPAGAPMPVPA
jgi:phosphonate transport system ATP-binding protein